MAKKVLLVDDEQDFLMLISKLITKWGYEVVEASDWQTAMELVKKERPDVLVLDYLMPDLNGIELLKKMRHEAIRVPAIVFTANPTIKAMEESRELNIAAFIPKISPYVDTQEDLKMALELLSR